MKNLKDGFTEHQNNRKIRAVVKQLNKLMESTLIEGERLVKFGYGMSDEGKGGIYVELNYSETLFVADHSIHTENPNETTSKDIYKHSLGIFNQIIDEISKFKIKNIEN